MKCLLYCFSVQLLKLLCGVKDRLKKHQSGHANTEKDSAAFFIFILTIKSFFPLALTMHVMGHPVPVLIKKLTPKFIWSKWKPPVVWVRKIRWKSFKFEFFFMQIPPFLFLACHCSSIRKLKGLLFLYWHKAVQSTGPGILAIWYGASGFFMLRLKWIWLHHVGGAAQRMVCL